MRSWKARGKNAIRPSHPTQARKVPMSANAVHMNVNMPHPTPPPQYMKIGSGNLIGNHHIKIIRKTWVILDLVDSWGLTPSSIQYLGSLRTSPRWAGNAGPQQSGNLPFIWLLVKIKIPNRGTRIRDPLCVSIYISIHVSIPISIQYTYNYIYILYYIILYYIILYYL